MQLGECKLWNSYVGWDQFWGELSRMNSKTNRCTCCLNNQSRNFSKSILKISEFRGKGQKLLDYSVDYLVCVTLSLSMGTAMPRAPIYDDLPLIENRKRLMRMLRRMCAQPKFAHSPCSRWLYDLSHIMWYLVYLWGMLAWPRLRVSLTQSPYRSPVLRW